MSGSYRYVPNMDFFNNLNITTMSYLRFDKTLMTNLEETLPREILRTNRSGAYHCTTIVDCNTRKYHGLLVIPIPELDDENHDIFSYYNQQW